jgi:predicted nucleic acid-binding protein
LTHIFFDTSALAKRYIVETGSSWIRSWMLASKRHVIIVSAITNVEMTSLVMRREREKSVTPAERIRILNNFLRHLDERYQVIELNDNLFDEARRLLVKHPLRALDAIQLASALRAAKILSIQPTFISADTRLLAAASAEGLPTDNPNTPE